MPWMVRAGVRYELATRPVDQTDMSLSAPAPVPVVTQYSVDQGKVRVSGPDAKRVYLFRDHTLFVIDGGARTVHALRHATLRDVIAHFDDTVHQFEDAAAAATPEQRTQALQKAADMKSVSERLRQPVQRDYRVTARFESVDGRACRIWEERESGAKRLELCVAPVASVPGGTEILSGMKTLSDFRQGGNVALGVEFGLSPWWADMAALSGVPLLIREYKFDSVISETELRGMRAEPPNAAQWALPVGYPVEEGPEYVQWYRP